MPELKDTDKIFEVKSEIEMPSLRSAVTFTDFVVAESGRGALFKVLEANPVEFLAANFEVIELHFDKDLKHKITIW